MFHCLITRSRFVLALFPMLLASIAWAGPRDLFINGAVVDTRNLANLKSQPPAQFDNSSVYILQLKQAITPEVRARLAGRGIVLGDYLNENAYLVELGSVKPATVQAQDEVAWVGPLATAWKVSPDLGKRTFATPARQALAAAGKAKVAVTLMRGRAPGKVLRALANIPQATVNDASEVAGNAVVSATLPLDSVAALAQLGDVQYIDEAPELTLRNGTTRWIIQSNVTNVTPLYDHGIHGEGQVVGILDGKVNPSHCSFRDDVNPIGPLHRKILAYNTSTGYNSHGTHVAGTAVGDAGADDNTRGMAYLAKLCFDDIPGFSETAVKNVLQQHHNQGARAHTNSWGDDGTTSYNSLCRGFDSFSYDNEDSLVMLAVTNTSTLKNPENAKNLLAVGASQDTPSQGSFCSGGQGPTADGRRKPEIYAPGCSTNSSTGSGTSCSTAGLTGTSMASPAVAGAALLARQYYTDGYYPSGTANSPDAFIPSGALVKATLLNSAVDMTGITGYPSNREGWGRVLLDNAVYFPGDTRALGVLDDVRNASGLSTGQQAEYNVNVLGSGEQLRVTLVWTDPPAAANTGTGPADINDLDLEVVAPDSTLYRGNFFSGGASVSGGTADDKNNVEQVHINGPSTGAWTVRVKGTTVAVGLQGYALVATGDLVLTPPDCNNNGIPDSEDISSGASPDCNENGIPDECEAQDDCNANTVLDFCEIYAGTALDCNTNDVPDDCELSGNDCNSNGVPDDCDSQADCNGNLVQDTCEVASGAADDCNGNGVPDDCEFSAPTVLYSADFESGLPAGWTASGLWHVTSACPRPSTCDGSSWGYFGIDEQCNFSTMLREDGTMQVSPISLPSDAAALTMTYCSSYVGENGDSNASGNDWAWISVNTIEWDDVSVAGDTPDWQTRTVDLTPFAGQDITIRFRFDSRNAALNNTLGWQVDNLVVSATYEGVNDCNSNTVLDSCEIASGQAADCNRNGVIDTCEAPVVCQCADTVLGDVSGDFVVNGTDVQKFSDCYMGNDVNAPGCACADMNVSGAFEPVDIAMFVDCELGVSCP